MGCCASSNHKAISVPEHQHSHSPAPRSASPCHIKAAPPPEEETVKEVLSEVPAPKPSAPAFEGEKKWGSRSLLPLRDLHQEEINNVEKKMPLVLSTDVSDVSEICSFSESVSTVTEKRDDDGEVQQRVDRSPARFRSRTVPGERRAATATAGKSPARRHEPCPSPGRVRSSPGREVRAVAADGKRWDSGEVSGRRSRSPATCPAEVVAAGGGLGRSPSGRKNGKSPGRTMSQVSDKTRKVEEGYRELTKSPQPTANESLENPLVSLECFIFL